MTGTIRRSGTVSGAPGRTGSGPPQRSERRWSDPRDKGPTGFEEERSPGNVSGETGDLLEKRRINGLTE